MEIQLTNREFSAGFQHRDDFALLEGEGLLAIETY
jgi:hypothetical protein